MTDEEYKNIISDLQDRAIYAEKRALELAREVGVWRGVVDKVRGEVEGTALLAKIGEYYTGESIRAWIGRLRTTCSSHLEEIPPNASEIPTLKEMYDLLTPNAPLEGRAAFGASARSDCCASNGNYEEGADK